MTPAVSVVVPVYKAEAYLSQCVDSILAQTLRDIQVILVDDGSPDGCPAMCDAYAERDRRVQVIHKENGGVASAVTAGIRAAGGTYVGFVDSDDWVDPDYFGQLYRCVTDEDADMAEGQMVNELDGQRTLGAVRSGTVIYSGEEDIRRLTGLYMRSFLYDGMPDRPDRPLTYSKCDKLFRRQVLTGALAFYDERLSLGEDVVLLAAAVPDCRRVVTLKSTARYHRRVVTGSVSHQAGEDQLDRVAAVHRTLTAMAPEKGLDRTDVDAFIGSMVHARIYRTAGLSDLPPGERRRRMRAMLKKAPNRTLEAFLQMRGSGSLRLFYGLLRAGLAAPCVWMVTAHSAAREK